MQTKLLVGLILPLICISNAFGSPKTKLESKPESKSELMRVLDAKSIIAEIQKSKAKVQVVNLWASWCEPCRKELPEFAEAEKKVKDVEFFYISGDAQKDAAAAQDFIDSTGVNGKRFRISEVSEKVFREFSPVWFGSLPTTLFYVRGVLKTTISKAFTQKMIEDRIKEHLKRASANRSGSASGADLPKRTDNE